MNREYPDRPIVGAGAIILHQERLLVVRRGRPPLQGEWSIPGGAVETGETLAEAVVRETLEEAAVVIEPVRVAEVVDRISRDENGKAQYHYVLIDYLCRYVSGTPKPGDDVTDVRWIGLEELGTLHMAEFTKDVIRRVAGQQGAHPSISARRASEIPWPGA